MYVEAHLVPLEDFGRVGNKTLGSLGAGQDGFEGEGDEDGGDGGEDC